MGWSVSPRAGHPRGRAGGGGGDVALEIHAMGMMLIVEWDESYSAVKNRIMSGDDVGSNKLDPWL